MSKVKNDRESESVPEEHRAENHAESGKDGDGKESSHDEPQEDGVSRVEEKTDAESGEKVLEEAGGQEAVRESQPEQTASQSALQDEVASLTDRLLRRQAEFENFRKRMLRERDDAIRFANQNLLLDLVEVVDNFERAIRSAQESKDFDSFYQGVELIERQFTGMLESKYGLKRFESAGEEFDPEKHEAIAAEEREGQEAQTVLEDYQKGYMLHDRVLRHAKVRVALPAQTRADANSSDDTDGKDE